MSFKLIMAIVSAVVLLAGCTTLGISNSRLESNWTARKQSTEFAREKALFEARMGKSICWGDGISTFTWKTEAPNPSCIFPAKPWINEGDRGGQYPKQLKILQVLPDGFLVQSTSQTCVANSCFDRTNPKTVFVQRTTEPTSLVDGDYLDEQKDGSTFMYEYSGPRTYQSLTGPSTVHSFRRVSPERFTKALEGLKTYDPVLALYGDNKWWGQLAKAWPEGLN